MIIIPVSAAGLCTGVVLLIKIILSYRGLRSLLIGPKTADAASASVCASLDGSRRSALERIGPLGMRVQRGTIKPIRECKFYSILKFFCFCQLQRVYDHFRREGESVPSCRFSSAARVSRTLQKRIKPNRPNRVLVDRHDSRRSTMHPQAVIP